MRVLVVHPNYHSGGVGISAGPKDPTSNGKDAEKSLGPLLSPD